MYRRFLNNNDYLGLITPEALTQITRGDNERFVQAEESAEMSIVEYLSENYEIERELSKGKYIAEYDRQICYPRGAYIYYQNKIHEVIKSIGGYKSPANVEYWDEIVDIMTWIVSSVIPSLKLTEPGIWFNTTISGTYVFSTTVTNSIIFVSQWSTGG